MSLQTRPTLGHSLKSSGPNTIRSWRLSTSCRFSKHEPVDTFGLNHSMDVASQRLVRSRANNRCEYCHLQQNAAPFLRFHIEHIYAKQHVQDDSLDNLALACPDCNRYKGPNLTTLDPQTRDIVVLFHPRQDNWDDHFEFQGFFIRGITSVGIATERLLKFNLDERMEMRAEIHSAE